MMSIKKSKLNILSYFIQRYRWQTLSLFLIQFGTGVIEGLGVAALLPLIDTMLNGAGGEQSPLHGLISQVFGLLHITFTLENTLLLIVGLFALKAALKYLAALYTSHLSSTIVLDFRKSFLNAILRSKWAFYINTPTGNFINALMLEAQRSGGSFRSIAEIISALMQMMILLIIASFASWELVAIGVATSLFMWVALYRFIRISGQTGLEQKDLSKKITANITDVLQNYKPLKAMNIENQVFQKIVNDIHQLFEIAKRQMMAKHSMGIFHEPIFIGIMCFGLYGAISFLHIETAVLMVLAAIFYRFVTSWKVLQQGYQVLSGQESFFWSLQDFIAEAKLEEEPYIAAGQSCELERSIKFDDVSFSYGGNKVLSHLNIEFPAHKIIGLSWPSGTGKTTVVDLLCRLYTPEDGCIWVDDKKLEETDLHLWRQNIGYIPQEFVIFNDTIIQNISLGDSGISEEQVVQALKKAEAWDFVSALPDGLYTVLGERGGRISGGQRQRISIARALVRDPVLLIMDEATASLDKETEVEIFNTLKKLSRSMTIVAISHQNTMKEMADIIIDLSEVKSVD